jgi:hypothetical protein
LRRRAFKIVLQQYLPKADIPPKPPMSLVPVIVASTEPQSLSLQGIGLHMTKL